VSHCSTTVKLRGRRSFLALVVAWLIVLVYAIGISLTIGLEHLLDVRDDPMLEDALLIVGFGAFAMVGALLVAKRHTNLIGWIMAAVALMVGLGLVGDAYVMTTRGQPDPFSAMGAWAQGRYWYLLLSLVVVYLPLLVPDGRLLSRWWLPVAVAALLGWDRRGGEVRQNTTGTSERGTPVTLFVTFGRRLGLRMCGDLGGLNIDDSADEKQARGVLAEPLWGRRQQGPRRGAGCCPTLFFSAGSGAGSGDSPR
jgi:hypothetical protein